MSTIALSAWIADFILRIKQLADLKLQLDDNSLETDLKNMAWWFI